MLLNTIMGSLLKLYSVFLFLSSLLFLLAFPIFSSLVLFPPFPGPLLKPPSFCMSGVSGQWLWSLEEVRPAPCLLWPIAWSHGLRGSTGNMGLFSLCLIELEIYFSLMLSSSLACFRLCKLSTSCIQVKLSCPGGERDASLGGRKTQTHTHTHTHKLTPINTLTDLLSGYLFQTVADVVYFNHCTCLFHFTTMCDMWLTGKCISREHSWTLNQLSKDWNASSDDLNFAALWHPDPLSHFPFLFRMLSF